MPVFCRKIPNIQTHLNQTTMSMNQIPNSTYSPDSGLGSYHLHTHSFSRVLVSAVNESEEAASHPSLATHPHQILSALQDETFVCHIFL